MRTPDECKQKLAEMRMVNPFVHHVISAQELNQWSNEDMLAVLALNVLEAIEEQQAREMARLKGALHEN